MEWPRPFPIRLLYQEKFFYFPCCCQRQPNLIGDTEIKRITIEHLDNLKEVCLETIDHAKSLSMCKYADLRLGISETKSAVSENGMAKNLNEDNKFSFGVRLIAGEIPAWGYFGQLLGIDNLKTNNLKNAIVNGIDRAYKRAVANAIEKCKYKQSLPGLAGVSFAQINKHEGPKVVNGGFKIDPRGIPLTKILRLAKELSDNIKKISNGIKHAHVHILTLINRELFCSTEGISLDQSYPLTQGDVYVVAQQDGGIPEVYDDCIGDMKGWEVIEGDNVYNIDIHEFGLKIARDTLELAGVEFLKSSKDEKIVVTNPHFNALLVHEIVGHPTEADRALKMETAYAGRTWFFKDFINNEIGKAVASNLVSVVSDPSITGYGCYKYDAEGVIAKRINLIENGILKTFMNGRESAAILTHEPNGSMRATMPYFMPLVRMTNTFFANGSKNPDEIIKEVDDGYYIENHKIPSISESRENFRISAQKTYKIEKGRLTRFYRGGGISADSRDFLMNIDAVGNDFKLFPIPNCGKGEPVQVMRVGNGGPTLRSRARLAGSEKME